MYCSVTGGKTNWFSNDNFDFSYLVTPGDNNTHCGTHFQGSNACRDSCCQTGIDSLMILLFFTICTRNNSSDYFMK